MPFDLNQGRHLAVGDARLFVVEAGNPAGAPLLLLHGGLGGVQDFDAIIDGLPQSLRLIGLELRGHGRSTRGSAPLCYAQYQADVLAVLDQIGIVSAGVLGFSDGGIVGYRLAAASPERVRLLVTLGSQWRLRGADDPSIPLLQGLTREGWQSLFPDAVASYEAHNPEPDFDALLAAVKAVWLDWSDAGYPGETVRQISAPTLLVRGDADPFLSLDEAVALRARIADSGFLNIPFVGHAAHDEATAVFLAAVNAFLNDPVRRADGH
ncbi:alpha/beta fold hydrolase [Corticibacter populi]|uniref:Alpha/beta fold hydrolase n=1 Tax=Corticibacter populi TaxID=1550736 RepID=A0A3M6QU63_9BURK|nr:alpha/beta hydrolase [Corticibacter populi]RMX06575.1 alpha/beta fold hydrolase [Corticibacter populi]RZS31858.1 pimeloyl-ACP methyl ester carboxylesterase [Corticibacter populi]